MISRILFRWLVVLFVFVSCKFPEIAKSVMSCTAPGCFQQNWGWCWFCSLLLNKTIFHFYQRQFASKHPWNNWKIPQMFATRSFAFANSYLMIEEILGAVGLSEGGKCVCYFIPLSRIRVAANKKNNKRGPLIILKGNTLLKTMFILCIIIFDKP